MDFTRGISSGGACWRRAQRRKRRLQKKSGRRETGWQRSRMTDDSHESGVCLDQHTALIQCRHGNCTQWRQICGYPGARIPAPTPAIALV